MVFKKGNKPHNKGHVHRDANYAKPSSGRPKGSKNKKGRKK